MADEKATPAPEAKQDQVESLFRSPIPKLYFNGFGLAMGTADVTIVLNIANMPVALLSTPYEVAKTFAEALANGVKEVEQKAKLKFHGINEISASLEGKSTK